MTAISRAYKVSRGAAPFENDGLIALLCPGVLQNEVFLIAWQRYLPLNLDSKIYLL